MGARGHRATSRGVQQFVASVRAGDLDDAALLERFLTHHDQAAFGQMMARHGPWVLGVCRRMLRDHASADDACQATFLILARRAGAIRDRTALGSWLHGVAFRTCQHLRSQEARRNHGEEPVTEPAATSPGPATTAEAQEVSALLDQELNRLPEPLRTPLVLCYLEGKTNEQAARQLGCPTSSLSWRLGKARDLLRKRLVLRGVSLSSAGLASLWSSGIADAAPAPSIIQAVLQHITTSPSLCSSSPLGEHVLDLADGAMSTMMTNRARTGLLLGCMAGLLLIGTGLAWSQAPSAPPPPARTAAPAPAPAGPRQPPTLDEQSDQAILKGLQWLRAQQAQDGHWAMSDGRYPEAATALAVLALLRATPTEMGPFYADARAIDAGLLFLESRQAGDGGVGVAQGTLYTHGLATMAFCEAAQRLKAPRWRKAARKGLDFLVSTQQQDGSWGYQPGARGDTSILHWQAQAIALGRRASLPVPDEVVARMNQYLATVGNEAGEFSYSPGGAPSPSMTAAGLLVSIVVDDPKQKERIIRGRERLLTRLLARDKPPTRSAYLDYVATWVMTTSPETSKRWLPASQPDLLAAQAEDGRWPSAKDPYAAMGDIFTTTFRLLTLEEGPAWKQLPTAPAHEATVEEVQALLKCLPGGDVGKSRLAYAQLLASPKSVVASLANTMVADLPADPARIKRLLTDLESDRFEVREAAEKALRELDDRAVGGIREALDRRPSLDVSRRLENILEGIRDLPNEESVRMFQSLHLLEKIGTPEAMAILQRLANGAAGTRQSDAAREAVKRLTEAKAAP